ncbi:MAG: hypothetical protein Q7J28_07730 [Caulobacter sp.]|nr:hypothetical protein [Caulobacter sp.]
MRRRLTLAALTAGLALPGVALADWQWTNWSMPVGQVIAGSGGTLRPIVGRDGQRVHGWDLKAVGPVTFEGFAFDGEFFFDPGGKALKVVRLTLKDPSQCEALEQRMTTLHGAPADGSRDLDVLKARFLRWADDGHGNFLGLTGISAIGDNPPLCFIRYRPLNPVNGG